MSDPKREKLEAEAREWLRHAPLGSWEAATKHVADWADRLVGEAVAERDREWAQDVDRARAVVTALADETCNMKIASAVEERDREWARSVLPESRGEFITVPAQARMVLEAEMRMAVADMRAALRDCEAKLAEARLPNELGIMSTANELSVRCRELRDRIVKQGAELAAARDSHQQALEVLAQALSGMSKRDVDLAAARERITSLESSWEGSDQYRAVKEALDRQTAAEDALSAARERERALMEELTNIATADPAKWDPEMRDQFQPWAQNRARAALRSTEPAAEEKP